MIDPLEVISSSPAFQPKRGTVKLAEYQSLSSTDYILFVDTETPNAHLYFRGEDGLWEDRIIGGLDAAIDFPKLGMV